MGALGPCFSLFQEYTVHTSRLFFLCRVSSYPIQKEEKNTANPTSLSGGEIEILKSGKMLTDRHVNSSLAIIKKDFPDIKG